MNIQPAKSIRDIVDFEENKELNDLPLDAERLRSLSEADIEALVDAGEVRFLVKNKRELRRIPAEKTNYFWNSSVRGKVIRPDRVYAAASSFPAYYFYSASEWLPVTGPTIILLEIAR